MFSEASVKIVIGGMVVLDNPLNLCTFWCSKFRLDSESPSMGRLLTHALRA